MLEEWGYRLLLVNTANDAAREVQAMEMLSHNTVDGLILIATVFTPQHKALLESMPLPIVVLGQQYPGCCCIVCHDDFGAAKAATARMLDKGRRLPVILALRRWTKRPDVPGAWALRPLCSRRGSYCTQSACPPPISAWIPAFGRQKKLFALTPSWTVCSAPPMPLPGGYAYVLPSKGVRIPEDVMLASVRGQHRRADRFLCPDQRPPALSHRRAAGCQTFDGTAERPPCCALQPDAGLYPASPGLHRRPRPGGAVLHFSRTET